MPRLRVLAGPTFYDLTEIQANSDDPFLIHTDAFHGHIAVYLKGFADPTGNVPLSSYFSKEQRKEATWSIQFQGRFLNTYSADDIMFGNVFDHSLYLPWGFSAITAFMEFLDPTLEQKFTSATPWALSPLITTMPYFQHSRLDKANQKGVNEPLNSDGSAKGELEKSNEPIPPKTEIQLPPFPPKKPIGEDVSELRDTDGNVLRGLEEPKGSRLSAGSSSGGENSGVQVNRKTYFQDPTNRKSVTFGPNDLITSDFCYNYLDFTPHGLSLRIPGGFSFDLMKYWDGQPIRFVCCHRGLKAGAGVGKSGGKEDGDVGDGLPWGRVFWCVAVEAVKE